MPSNPSSFVDDLSNLVVAKSVDPIWGVPLGNARYPKIFGSNIQIGDTDLYTCPPNKKTLIFSGVGYNPSIGSISVFTKIKINSVYYRLSSTLGISSGTANILNVSFILLLPNETLAINCITTAGLNVSFQAIEFDFNSSITIGKKVGLIAGNNTLYTCPHDKTATILGINTTGVNPIWINFNAAVVLITPTIATVYTNLVPSGSSPSNANRFGSNSTTSANARSSTGPSLGGNLSAGDYINLNTTVTDPNALAFVVVLETP